MSGRSNKWMKLTVAARSGRSGACSLSMCSIAPEGPRLRKTGDAVVATTTVPGATIQDGPAFAGADGPASDGASAVTRLNSTGLVRLALVKSAIKVQVAESLGLRKTGSVATHEGATNGAQLRPGPSGSDGGATVEVALREAIEQALEADGRRRMRAVAGWRRAAS
jgi:hypothetical protein